jgi:hypothetical protein
LNKRRTATAVGLKFRLKLLQYECPLACPLVSLFFVERIFVDEGEKLFI